MNNHKADNNPNSAAIDAEDLVLVIEDNDELREFIRQSIQGRYQVITAANGEEGILQAIKHLPNIIISDLMMPKKDGFQVCEILKTDERTSHIPIILLTAKTAMESKLKGLQQGADAYMAKPFNTQELLIRIHNLVKIRKELSLKFQEAKGKEAENILSNIDQLFMNRLNHIFEKNIANEEFTVKDVGEKLKMSRSQLHRKVKALTNQSVSEYLRGYRLETAYQILKNKDMNINEVMEKVGFKHQSYFAKIFKERFGISPSKVKLKEKE